MSSTYCICHSTARLLCPNHPQRCEVAPHRVQCASFGCRRHVNTGHAGKTTAQLKGGRQQASFTWESAPSAPGDGPGMPWGNAGQPWDTHQDARQLTRPEGSSGVHARLVHERVAVEESLSRARTFFELMDMRRSVRFFSSDEVPLEVIQECIRTAGTAPSGAHAQPWSFVVVRDARTKSQIRRSVEEAEQHNYEKRMGRSWVEELQPIVGELHKEGVRKPYLDEAPYLIVQFEHKWQPQDNGKHGATYYSTESNGIAAGLLIAAVQNANLTTVCSTPLGAGEAIRQLLGRPENERVYLLMPVGYPAETCSVPFRTQLRKDLSQILTVI